MTFEEYKKSLEKLKHKTADGRYLSDVLVWRVDVWSNDAARGYAIRAAELAEVDPETIKKIIRMMGRAFDDLTTDEAEKIYIDSPY